MAVEVDVVSKPKAGEADVGGATPNTGALFVVEAVELWPKVKPVEATGAEVAAFGSVDGAPKENTGALFFGCPKPTVDSKVGVDGDDPNVKPDFGGAVSIDLTSNVSSEALAERKSKDGTVASFGFTEVVKLFSVLNGSDDSAKAAPVASLVGA